MKKTLDQAGSLKGKRVLLRVDFNLPVVDGVVCDDTRIQRVMPTVHTLSSQGARVILLSHFGRPKGTYNADLSLKQIIPVLEERLGMPIRFAENCIGSVSHVALNDLPEGGVILLENTRFHAGEEKNDPSFIKELATNGDVFVNDSFSTAHRAHASTEGLAHVMPSFMGFALQNELEMLNKVIGNPLRPIAAIIGGSKVSTKIDLLTNLVTKVDMIIIGGGMANTFLGAQGISMGRSLCEYELFDLARRIMNEAVKAHCKIILPVDGLVAQECTPNTYAHSVSVKEIPLSEMLLDAGQKSIHQMYDTLNGVATVVWNGPLGVFEIPPFDTATVSLARYVGKRTRENHLISVAGGGDTVSALCHAGVVDDFSYVSTAGGAFLEWMEGKILPGIAALENSDTWLSP